MVISKLYKITTSKNSKEFSEAALSVDALKLHLKNTGCQARKAEQLVGDLSGRINKDQDPAHFVEVFLNQITVLMVYMMEKNLDLEKKKCW